MGISPSTPYNSRVIIDPTFYVSASVPSAYSSSVSASASSFDLKNTVAFPCQEQFFVTLFTTNTVGLSGSGAVNITVQHSFDNITFVNIPQLNPILLTITASQSPGSSSASSTTFYFPPDVRRYVQPTATATISSSLPQGLSGSFGMYFNF